MSSPLNDQLARVQLGEAVAAAAASSSEGAAAAAIPSNSMITPPPPTQIVAPTAVPATSSSVSAHGIVVTPPSPRLGGICVHCVGRGGVLAAKLAPCLSL